MNNVEERMVHERLPDTRQYVSRKAEGDGSELRLISDMLKHIQAPKVDLDVFSGNVLDYEYFMTTFIESVETKIVNPRGCLTRLIQFLEGEAKELVKGYVYLPAEEGYLRAKQLLDKRYGDSNRVLSEYRKQLSNWPKLNEPESFRRFYFFLTKFESAVLSYKCTSGNSPELLQSLQGKLPVYLQDRWNRQVFDIREKGREVGLQDFIGLIDKETTLVNDPLYSRETMSVQSPKLLDGR